MILDARSSSLLRGYIPIYVHLNTIQCKCERRCRRRRDALNTTTVLADNHHESKNYREKKNRREGKKHCCKLLTNYPVSGCCQSVLTPLISPQKVTLNVLQVYSTSSMFRPSLLTIFYFLHFLLSLHRGIGSVKSIVVAAAVMRALPRPGSGRRQQRLRTVRGREGAQHHRAVPDR